eukprot:6492709-Amphidinium_carterae.4
MFDWSCLDLVSSDTGDVSELLPEESREGGLDESWSELLASDSHASVVAERESHVQGCEASELVALHLSEPLGLQLPPAKKRRGRPKTTLVSSSGETPAVVAQSVLAASNAGYHMKSRLVRAKDLNMTIKMMGQKLLRLSWGQCIFQRHIRVTLENAMACNFGMDEKIVYIDAMKYDETPMKTRLAIQASGVAGHSGACPGSEEGTDCASLLSLVNGAKDDVVTKILQCKQAFAMLVKVGTSYLHVHGNTICPLQALARTSAENLMYCLQRLGASSMWSESFAMKTRLACSDRAASNLRAEELLVHSRTAGWALLSHHCEVHKTSSTIKRSIEAMLPAEVKGMLHTALAMRQSASMTVFRDCLTRHICKKLKVLQGSLGADAVEYRKSMLNIFCNGEDKLLERMILSTLPNGDWRHDTVEYYIVGDPSSANKTEVSGLLSNGLIYAMVRKKPVLFPRHRWTGADDSLDCLGLLAVCRNLLQATFVEFCKVMLGTRSGASTDEAHVQHAVVEAGFDDDDDDDDAMMTTHGSNQHVEGHAGAVQVEPPHEQVEQFQSAEQHARNRNVALHWITGSAHRDYLLIMRLAIAPLMDLLHSQFKVASDAWEIQQQVLVVRHMQADSEGCSNQMCRHWMVTIAAQMLHEQSFMQSLSRLYDNQDCWQLLLQDRWTNDVRAMIFKILSRQGCAIEELLKHPHGCFPVKLFKLIHSPHLKADMCSQPACMMDAWTVELIAHIKDCDEEQMLQILVAHAQQLSTNIAVTETLHASIRRQISSQVQTWCKSFEDISSEWVCQSFRCSQGSLLRTSMHAVGEHKQGDKQRQKVPVSASWCVHMQGNTTSHTKVETERLRQ